MDEPKADEWLFEVEDVFDLRGVGLVIVFSLELAGAILRVGDALTFLCADGREVETHIKSFPLISYSLNQPEKRKLITLELPRTEANKQITAGAQAFRRAADGGATGSDAAS